MIWKVSVVVSTSTREFPLVLREIEAVDEGKARRRARGMVRKYYKGAKVKVTRCVHQGAKGAKQCSTRAR